MWLLVAAALAIVGRRGRRAALRGTLSLGLASAAARRPRARLAPAAAFATGACIESPRLGAPAAALALAGAPWREPSAVAVGAGLGAGVAWATTRVWPVAPDAPAQARRAPSTGGQDPSPRGDGLTVVVNTAAGPALSRDPVRKLREGLPDATIIEVEDPEQLEDALRTAAQDRALGIAGGDGSINAAAAVADEAGKPLLVVPAGTLNHLARDLGLESVDDAVEAVHAGSAAAVDVATIDGRLFLNTASFGSYVELVDARERLQTKIGKWPAVVVALVRVLHRSSPCRVEIDGKPVRLWMIFVGNCRYHPSGFAPSWRERLDDGQLDVRIVDGDAPFSRTRLVLAVLTGRLGRCRVYSQRSATEVRVRSLDGPLRLARDGEIFDGSQEFTIAKDGRSIPVYVAPA